ncbi:MAG: flavodoxin family protein [Firmicutes bacterium]|nr:flavodoxin family protein [Bacillota bacterium]
MKALFVNGSPRKKWNTDQMLDAAVKGAESAGVQCEKIHLYDYEYKGCISCFACKVKGSKTNGLCAYKDALRPVLEKAREADMIIIGTPLYYSYPTGQTRSFMERLMFPVGTYLWENGKQILIRDKVIPTGIIYTMNLPRDMMEEADYPVMLKDNELSMNQIFGYCESLYICDTYQFRDYSRYDINLFDPVQKAEHRKQFFQKELESAYEFGRRIASMIPEERSK